MLYDAYVSEAEIGYKATSSTLSLLSRQIQEISGKNAYENFMSYWVLQVSNYGVGKGAKEAGMFMGVGRRILNELKQEQPPIWLNRKYKPGSAGF